MVFLASILFVAVAIWLQIQYNVFVPKLNGLRILMYHKLDGAKSDFLTLKVSEFEKQIEYLLSENYQFISLSEFLLVLNSKGTFPKNSVLLTFDDGYQNNFDHLLPVLQKHQLKAAIFLPVSFIGKKNEWDKGSDKLMDFETLKKAQPHFEYGLHSYSHRNMAEMESQEFEQDLQLCKAELDQNNLDYLPALAYPYGRYPKFAELDKIMAKLNLKAAFRIGNKINSSAGNPYLLKRIDIRGTDSFWEFKTKVAKGRVKMF